MDFGGFGFVGWDVGFKAKRLGDLWSESRGRRRTKDLGLAPLGKGPVDCCP